MTEKPSVRDAFRDQLGDTLLGEELFDAVPDTVFFIKDAKGRYVAANQTLVARTGLAHRDRLIGRRAQDVFAGLLGQRFAGQDEAVIATGKPLQGVLELHLYPGNTQGWCLTWKHPVRGKSGRIIGLIGISRDVKTVAMATDEMAALSRVTEHVQSNLARPMRVSSLAGLADMSPFQLDSRMRSVFGMTATQYITRQRIDEACTLLRTTEEPVSQIAQSCGYGDQAAFTRAFRHLAGMTPRQYRVLRRVGLD